MDRRRPALAGSTWAVWVAVLVGLAVRAWIIASPLGTLDSDEAVWGLMAERTLHGHPSVFFWNQSYGGTQEVFLLASVFVVTGMSVVAMRVVELALFAVATVLVWRIGRRTVGEPAARLAAALLWVWPGFLLWRSTRSYGFYGSALVLALGAVLLVLRLRERRSVPDLVLLGLCLGLGWWATPQTMLVAAPAVGWLAYRRPRLLRDAAIVVPAALVGAAPWLVWNVGHGWSSVHALPAGAHNSYLDRLVQFVATTLPTMLGLRVPWSLVWLVPSVLGRALTVAAIAAVAWLAVRRRRGGLEPILVVAALFPFLYALSPYDWLISDPRYMTMLVPVAALLVAAYASRPLVAAAVLVAAAALSAAALVPMERDRLPLARDGGRLVPTDLAPALTVLREHRQNRVVAPYWVAYRITFESDRRILATAIGVERDPVAARLVAETPHPAHVFFVGEPGAGEARTRLHGYRRVIRGPWVVYVWPRDSADRTN